MIHRQRSIRIAIVGNTKVSTVCEHGFLQPLQIGRVDACPAPRGDVLAEAARLLGVTAPLRAATDSSASSCRRISSSSTLVRLGLTLRHASYREGLAALASDDVAPFGRWGGAPEL